MTWPDGIDVRGYEAGRDDGELFAAYADAFSEHWGEAAVVESEWWEEIRDAPNAGFNPALWFLAFDGATIAGFSFCREREEDGVITGWVSIIGVRPAWRGRGLGEALLTHGLNTLRSRGLARAALNVDAENTTGAVQLYRKAGMEPKPAFTVWSIPL